MKYIIGFLVIIVVIVGIAINFISEKTIQIHTDQDTYSLFVDIADEPSEQSLGLMGRDELPDGEGMLFLYDKEGYPSFWMKNMKIPIDIIFIGTDKKIRQIFEQVQPCIDVSKECEYYIPSFPSQYVLEVNSGYTKRRSIKIGDLVEF